MTKKINLPCNGNGGINGIGAKNVRDTITFATSGVCTFTSFNFVWSGADPYYPPGFSSKNPADGVGSEVSYSYDGTPIPDTGYDFVYSVTTPIRGNGSGTIKNT